MKSVEQKQIPDNFMELNDHICIRGSFLHILQNVIIICKKKESFYLFEIDEGKTAEIRWKVL